MQSNKAVLSEWNLQSWEGRHYETSVRTLQDEEKPFIQKGEIIHSWTGIILRSCNMNASSHTDFLLVLEMTSSLICRDFHNNSVSVMYMIELATAESNTQFIPDLIVPACCQQQCVSWQAILAFRYTTRTHSPFNCIAEFFHLSRGFNWHCSNLCSYRNNEKEWFVSK